MPKEETTSILENIVGDEKKEELDLLTDDEETVIPVDEKKKRPRGLKSKLDIF